MRRVRMKSGIDVPRIGMGTWRMGEDRRKRRDEVEALQAGLDLGMTLVDTAELYGDGGAEKVVAEAIAGRRDEVFLVSKVLPSNASRKGTLEACRRSLRRLATDRIDLYLLHWPGSYPVAETLEAFARLRDEGKVRYYGVSNFDTAGTKGAYATPHGEGIASNQLYYNLGRRGIEWSLLPWCRDHGLLVMAYTPLETGELVRDVTVAAIARRRGATPAQVAIAWTAREDHVVSIPKAGSLAHVTENAGAIDLLLDAEDLAALDAVFPPPDRERPLETA